ncbi:hypothetical protein [Moritella sp. F3]|uniref:hypothetical protein n=1 Tax=Moritella sp. F3 TaxID=2718882 RepID=UPI0018E18456|nr:hypothetical protein [Moritella sp. F3]GIC77042.1 hypothetical protein FMO001_17690 [Moritella sp. F1]GIC82161.1 hypothetical protein FMO003_24420 [Moritella sp. F3]
MPRQFNPSLIELVKIQIRIKIDSKVLTKTHQFNDKITKSEISYLCNGNINEDESHYILQLKGLLNSEYYLKLLDWNRTNRHAKKNISRTVRLAAPTIKILNGLKERPNHKSQSDDYLIREALMKLS